MQRSARGFTLVEIAIVLVIIGLLLGGILKGQEMIVQAKVKNVVADFSGISAAYHGYFDRYRAIPGDDAGAATRWTTPTVAVPGNGNGQVTGAYNAAGATPEVTESRLFWDHLRRAGFVAGSGAAQPTNAFGGMMGVQTGDALSPIKPALGSDAAGTGGFPGLIFCSANLQDKVAIGIDNQMDDGKLVSGLMRGLLGATNPAIPANAGTTDFVETGANQYAMCRAF